MIETEQPRPADVGYATRHPFRTGNFTFHEGRRRFVDFLANEVSRQTSGPILDVGCGAGHFLVEVTRLGVEATGFDLNLEALDRRVRDSGIRVRQHDANKTWPFREGTFAAVTMFDVLEHFGAYEFALLEARRVLSPGGTLFLITVNRHSILRYFFGRHWGPARDPGHRIIFDRAFLSHLLARVGFVAEESRTFFNFGVAGESSRFLLPFRRPGLMVFAPELGDSIYVRARSTVAGA